MAHIEKRGKNSYRIIISPERGKLIRKTIKAPDGLKGKALQAWLEQEAAAFELEVRTGRYIRPSEMTFTDFIVEWERYYAVKELSPTTLAAYRSYIHNHILPVFGRRRLADISAADLVRFMHSLDEKKMHHNTKAYVWRVLKNIISRAYEWKYVQNNPASEVKGPAHSIVRQSKRGVAWSAEEVELFLRALAKEELKWQALAMLALFGGLRRGEILGLEWRHVDFDTRTVVVIQTVVRSGSSIEVKTPKTKSSIRKISMPESAMYVLREYKKEWTREKLQNLTVWENKDSEFLFHMGDGRPMYPTTPNKWLRNFLKSNGLPMVRLHDLRHISASILIASGVPVRVVSERLGHSKTTTTQDIYAHVIREMDDAASKVFDDLFRIPNRLPKSDSQGDV